MTGKGLSMDGVDDVGRRLTRVPAIPVAALGAAGAFAGARAVESYVVALVRPTPIEWFWLSDVLLAAGLGLTLWLWIRLRVTQGSLRDEERRRLVLDVQLATAAEIQAQLLSPMPDERAGVSWAARLQPAERIGGDYYDVLDLPDGGWLLLIADISGKGIPAALLLAYTRALFHQAARDNPDPIRICRTLSDAVHADTGGNPYLTCIVGRLEADGRRLTYVNAGHPPGLLFTSTGLRHLETGGAPVGVLPSSSYRSETVRLSPGDMAVFVTDGVTEALAHGVTELGTTLMRRRADGKLQTAEAACRVVVDLATHSTPPIEGWYDDRTVVVFRLASAVESSKSVARRGTPQRATVLDSFSVR
jgi:hypothetical protein